MTFPQADSLKRRYAFKLFANMLGFLVGIATQAIIPRGLGPVAYGNYNFLTSFFQQVFGFLEMGTSTCFYTRLSQRHADSGLVSFYLYFSVLISFLVVLFAAGVHATGFAETLWPGQEMKFVSMGVAWGILAWFSSSVLNRMMDAYALTVSSEIARMGQKIFSLLLIVGLFFSNLLNLTSFFLFNYAGMGFLCVASLLILELNGYSVLKTVRLSMETIYAYVREFYVYSHPLFVGSIVGLLAGLLDRWLLQYFSGSAEQGFYGLSYVIGSSCFLFTGAMTPLLWREFSIAHSKGDIPKMAHLFNRYVPLLYSISAALACFMAVQAEPIVRIMGGKEYEGALLPVVLMSFYPVHQTYGQLNSVLCMAAGQTKLYSRIGIAFAMLGIPVGYVLLAPETMGGANAGAAGLAIKMVMLQFLGVNVQLYYNCQLLGLGFLKYLWHQVFSVGLLIVFSLLSAHLARTVFPAGDHFLLTFFAAGTLYSCLIISLLFFRPGLMGLQPRDISSFMNFFKERVRVSRVGSGK